MWLYSSHGDKDLVSVKFGLSLFVNLIGPINNDKKFDNIFSELIDVAYLIHKQCIWFGSITYIIDNRANVVLKVNWK